MTLNKTFRSFLTTSWVCISILVSSCAQARPAEATVTAQPTIAPPATATPLPTPTSTPKPPAVWLSPNLPQDFIATIQLPGNWLLADQQETADIYIQPGDQNQISNWIYTLVAPFPTVEDSISSEDFLSIWQGNLPMGINVQKIYLAQNTLNVLQSIFGTPSSSIEVLPDDQISQRAWQEKTSWAVIPFEHLAPEWKVIQIDNNTPIQKTFDQDLYLLNIPISATGESENSTQMLAQIGETNTTILQHTNRDAAKLTTVVLTGVTALVRATAAMMEYRGMTYPGEDIRDILQEADFTHINNEVPFAENCPTPRGEQETLVFCSKPEYIELLEDIGTDIVDLSGDHFADWGDEAIFYTLDLYQQENWMVFGGGVNIEEGKKPLKIEHNGNKIAFLGCNAKDPGYAQASATKPGAVHCDMDYMVQEIKSLKEEGYLPIVTLQHIEYYSYGTNSLVVPDFEQLAEAGAIIVSGNQAHQPQALEFHQGALLHYGLGNLFFDQFYEGLPMRQAFIDRHVFYGNRHISTELITIMFIDYARPRLMTTEEREDVLTTVFNASGWNISTED